jgi:tetratricopeptide (TPR) repeat protein
MSTHSRRPFRTVRTFVVGALIAACVSCSRSDEVASDASVLLEQPAATADVTFNRDVAPIIFANCATCHRPGESAPFSLLTFDDARRRAAQIAEVTGRRFMPPWLPERGHGKFSGARRLTDADIATLEKWAVAGAPEGDVADLPAPPSFPDGWQLGPADLVLESPPSSLAAEGGDAFRNFVIPIELASPQWVEAIELRPTNQRVTHHARLGVDRTYESVRRDAEDEEPGYEGMAWGQDPDSQLVTWAPGMTAHRGTHGVAWRLHPKTSLVLHTHMQPSGKQETVQFRVGIHFADHPPEVRPAMLRIGSRNIDIHAGESRHVVSDEFIVPVAVDVHSIFPHAHSLCREIRVEAMLPDGTQTPLIWIKDFDENWHDNYRFVEPLRLPARTKLASTFVYDNTDANIRNRNHPPRRVVYGSNVADEMADVYLQVTAVRPDQRAVLMEDFEQQELRSQIVGFSKTLEMYPRDPWSYEGLAACYLAMGDTAEAIRLLEERLSIGEFAVHSLLSLAMACQKGGDNGRAEELCRQAISMDAEYPLAWVGLGRALDAQGESAEADSAYRRAIELAPALTDGHMGLVDNLLKQGKLDEAASTCEAAIEVSPDVANTHLKLAEIRARQKRFDDSLKELETAKQLAPYTHPPKVLLAVYSFQSGDKQRAKKLLSEAHAELPDHPVPELFLGQFAMQVEKWGDARKYLEGAASRAVPDNWPASHMKRFLVLLHSERLKLAQQLQDATLAKSAAGEWLKVEPENGSIREVYEGLLSGKDE